jgi:dihydrofolate synthase/folylpolyglutamate synthase
MADRYENVQLALRGRHQIENTAVAIQLAESLRSRGFTLPPAAIVRGIETASHLGRLSDHDDGRRVLLDGAHNPAAARALRDYLDEFVGEPITLVFGAMSDKRLAEIAAILFPGADRLVLTQPNNPRAAAVETLQTLAENFLPREQIIAAPRVADAMQKAREVTSPAGVICVTGSLYLVGEVSGELSRVG